MTIKVTNLSKGDVFAGVGRETFTVARVSRSKDQATAIIYVDEQMYPKRYPIESHVELVADREAAMAVHPSSTPQPIAVYPVGTRIGDVKHFDRGQKVVFHCPKHPARHWASKDPFSSSWFDAGKEFGDLEECDCNTRDYVVKFEYKPTRNG